MMWGQSSRSFLPSSRTVHTILGVVSWLRSIHTNMRCHTPSLNNPRAQTCSAMSERYRNKVLTLVYSPFHT